MRREHSLDEEDYVWLSLAAQKLHINHKHGKPMDEEPFKIVKKIGYETYKVLRNQGICITL